ncbi:MAG: hypothetical protein QXX87_00210 [Candidatus Jordarchaeales archaeon]
MLKSQSGKLAVVYEKIKSRRIVRKVAEFRVVKAISQSRVVRRIWRVFKASRYPTREEIWLLVRICVVGILLIGGIAFVTKLLLSVLFYPQPVT